MAGKRAGPGEPGWNGAWLKSANARVRRAFLDGLGQAALEHRAHDWRIWARPDQAAPAGAALDDPSASTATITPRALGLQPLSPVHGRARRGSDGLEAVWIRRTRLGGDDWAARDAPLGEEEERYVVRVRAAGGALLAETECSEPSFSMPASALDALSEPPAFLEVAQVSRAAGEGARLRIDVLG
jgi:hypothetical protein